VRRFTNLSRQLLRPPALLDILLEVCHLIKF
jgi:hypothetical protein